MHRLVFSSFRPVKPVIVPRVVAAILAFMLMSTPAATLAQGAAAPPVARPTAAGVGRIQISAEANAPADATILAERYRLPLAMAWEQLSALFATEPARRFLIRFELEPDPAVTSRMRPVSDAAWATTDGSSALIAIERFLALSPVESNNILRNLLSRAFLHAASGGYLPIGLVDGAARYVETPVLARQARLGSLVQGVYQAGTLPGWDDLITGAPSALDAETLAASRYALVAFLAERYGIRSIQEMVHGFASEPAWSVVIPSVTRQSVAEMDAAWQDFLPRWVASGWRQNAAAGFDVSRAQSLFERGAYEAAAAEAGRSQRLFTELDDQPGLRRVEGLLAQSALGLQADQLMTDAEQALRAHDYARVVTLLDTVEGLYATLPESHRPVQTVDTYRSFAERGLDARRRLGEAEAASSNWLAVKGARSEAISAGETFAFLGDTGSLEQAHQLVDDLDQRLHRLIFTLSALTITIGGWLFAWMWYRAPGRLLWRSPVGPARTPRRAGG